MKRIAIIGAGLSGLILGEKISNKAHVTIFEKARGVGGRMATRYASPFVFDHGAPYWTAETEEFQNFLKPLMNSVIAPWSGTVVTLGKDGPVIKETRKASYFVGKPNMNSFCKHLALGLDIQTQCEVASITLKNPHNWHLMAANGRDLGVYDMVISTAPSPQTVKLFSHHLPKDHMISKLKFESCFALMIGLNKAWDKEWMAAHVCNSPIKWIGVNSTKPGRNHNLTCLVIHSDPQWTKAHIDKNINEVEELLLKELTALIHLDTTNLDHISTHRWLYSQIQPGENLGYFVDTHLGLYAIGDWCEASNIEKTWLHGQKFGSFLLSNM